MSPHLQSRKSCNKHEYNKINSSLQGGIPSLVRRKTSSKYERNKKFSSLLKSGISSPTGRNSKDKKHLTTEQYPNQGNKCKNTKKTPQPQLTKRRPANTCETNIQNGTTKGKATSLPAEQERQYKKNKKYKTINMAGNIKLASASTTGGGSISAPAGIAPAGGSSTISTGPTGVGEAGISAIEEKADAG